MRDEYNNRVIRLWACPCCGVCSTRKKNDTRGFHCRVCDAESVKRFSYPKSVNCKHRRESQRKQKLAEAPRTLSHKQLRGTKELRELWHACRAAVQQETLFKRMDIFAAAVFAYTRELPMCRSCGEHPVEIGHDLCARCLGMQVTPHVYVAYLPNSISNNWNYRESSGDYEITIGVADSNVHKDSTERNNYFRRSTLYCLLGALDNAAEVPNYGKRERFEQMLKLFPPTQIKPRKRHQMTRAEQRAQRLLKEAKEVLSNGT